MQESRLINVLLVEDDEVDVMNVRRAFKKSNISNPLYIATNGIEALAMLRRSSNQCDAIPAYRRLILLDLNMPKMGGIEFLNALRADPVLKKTPVVVLTTSNRDQDRAEAYHFNIAGYLVKPVTFNAFTELMATLNQYWMLCEMP
ncbi:response regulator [Phormidium sp. CLA17]|nr:response regulator [Leptolyngbya sp. Cla-17]